MKSHPKKLPKKYLKQGKKCYSFKMLPGSNKTEVRQRL